nr:hypothetical protein [Tanacetum cinerariifolium]
RRRHGIPRKIRGAAQAHRGAAGGRPARAPHAPLRARLLGAAPLPEGGRDSARRGPHRVAAAAAVRLLLADWQGRGLRQRGHGRVFGKPRAGPHLFYRSQPPHPGFGVPRGRHFAVFRFAAGKGVDSGAHTGQRGPENAAHARRVSGARGKNQHAVLAEHRAQRRLSGRPRHGRLYQGPP